MHLLSFCWLPAGDIAFRFLSYVQAQHQRRQRRQLRTQQNLSWEEIAKKYQNEEDSLGGSLATVCDINREMLKVGKQKALDQGHTAGESPGRHGQRLSACVYSKRCPSGAELSSAPACGSVSSQQQLKMVCVLSTARRCAPELEPHAELDQQHCVAPELKDLLFCYDLFLMCLVFNLHMCLCSLRCLVPTEARRGHQIS